MRLVFSWSLKSSDTYINKFFTVTFNKMDSCSLPRNHFRHVPPHLLVTVYVQITYTWRRYNSVCIPPATTN